MTGDSATDPAPRPACADEVCLTCGDHAEPGTVLELRPDRLALVQTAAGHEEVSVALVSARVGDTVLVHAKEAIGIAPAPPGRTDR
ncbi:HypC/HybG/HupF family hydrogenase formation chaperone [Plantactinospora endophytica]|uniref:Hydrogenase assembly protein HupF n=1 Tax=Plantactinospora endophytica TaxID=673535 RepID=A0ABQ4DZT0_9ACTN|nr:HypC/HybG/HupF family hydrogenase formation chaperone [Plantactinospora endophytica]GIG87983.1 hypothetical protein Pen02_29190 [Plantactinospora endophytica]